MAQRKDFAALTADADEQTNSPLFRLAPELFDQIMDLLFVQPRPIEFSPIESNLFAMTHGGLGSSQYQHALDYQVRIRPALGTLRLCKSFFARGSALYYGKDEFRFSSYYGGLVLARFLDAIGPNHIPQLRDITVVHPHLWTPYARICHFPVRRLSPFGLADLPGYMDAFAADHGLRVRHDPLETLFRAGALQKLTLLFYPLDPSPSLGGNFQNVDDSPPMSQPDFWDYEAHGMLSHRVNTMKWDEIPGLKVKLLNLYPYDSDHIYGTEPLRLRAVEVALRNPTHTYSLLTEPVPDWTEAPVTQLRRQGWEFEDTAFSLHTGNWPLRQLPDGSFTNESTCEDEEGWSSRSAFEELWAEQSLSGHPDGVLYDECVRCWRSRFNEGCRCEDGGQYLPWGWNGPRILIANPGKPIAVETTLSEGAAGDVTWEKSQAEKDMDGCSDRDWWEVCVNKV